MISRNLRIRRDGEGFWVRLSDLDRTEIEAIMEKHKGEAHVTVTKPLKAKTAAQLAAFHPLALAFYLTGMHSAPDQFRQSPSLFKYWLKIEFGPTLWVEYQGSHVPICKSISKYTSKEMSTLIEGLICMINESGANAASKDIRDIIEGMSKGG